MCLWECAHVCFISAFAAANRYDAIYVIPTTNSCLVASGIFGAICVLREIPESWGGFVGGLFLCVGGILVLTITHEHAPLRDAEVSADLALQEERFAETLLRPAC